MLSRRAIKHLMLTGLIEIEPLPEKIGPNSVDLHLGDSLKMYSPASTADLRGRVKVLDPVSGGTFYALDPKAPPELVDVPKLPDGRWLLTPGQFYIGVTRERTKTVGVVPHLDGRSTCGRLSIEAHKTAGVGDNGFNGRWTLEIEVTEPVLVSPGDRLFQIYFSPCWGEGLALLLESLLVRGVENPKWKKGALLELEDLYGGEGHHYQGSEEARGASPLD